MECDRCGVTCSDDELECFCGMRMCLECDMEHDCGTSMTIDLWTGAVKVRSQDDRERGES